MKIHYVIAIHLTRWQTNFYDFRFKWTATAGIGNTPWLSQLVNFKNAIWTLEERYAIEFCFKLGKMPCKESWIYCYDPDIKRQSSQGKPTGPPRPKKARQSKSTLKLLMIPFFDCTGMIYMQWVPTGQQGILWSFKGVQEEILWKEASTLQIGSVAFPPGQCTSLQLHPCHRLFDQDGH